MRPGSVFSEKDVRPAGHIFFIPPEDRPGDDPKLRPHFLVNRCDLSADPYALGTLAHMSTKATELTEYASPGHEIADPGTARGSFVVTTRLLPQPAEALRRSGYAATGEVDSVRRSVRRAVGLGEGLAPSGSASVRGRLVRILDSWADFRFGCVLTSHEYSARRRYQVVIPVIDRILETEDGVEELGLTHWDVIPDRKGWPAAVPLAEPLLETAALLSFTEEWQRSRDSRTWLRKQIEITPVTIDHATLSAIERKIEERLQL